METVAAHEGIITLECNITGTGYRMIRITKVVHPGYALVKVGEETNHDWFDEYEILVPCME